MRREFQVRFCEGLGVRFPRATQPGAQRIVQESGRLGLEIGLTQTL
jgi:hypothetical protein